MVKCDFSGYATRNDLLCGDGRTIRKNAFKDNHGQTVPLVWNHDHANPDAVLGHALLENRDDGVYAYCTLNDTDAGKNAKELVRHGDVRSLSIYANKLKQVGDDVIHGSIRELSLVLAGANPGAYIDYVLAHGEDSEDSLVANYDENALVIYHSDEEEKKQEEEIPMNENPIMHAEAEEKEETVADVFNTLSEKQKNVVYAMIGQALEDAGVNTEEDEEDTDMKHNIFEQDEVKEGGVLSHSDQAEIIRMAKSNGGGSLKHAIETYASNSLSHGFVNEEGAEGIDMLFPDYKLTKPGAPELLERDMDWVAAVMRGAHKSPISRIRTRNADARAAELKAMGYGDRSKEKKVAGDIKLLTRTTDPQTIYRKDTLHRDDIIDITDFDVVEYNYTVMRHNLEEEIAKAIMIGDGRGDGDEGKIQETHIRPIWKDDEFYTIHVDVDIEAAREELQGSETGAHFGENYVYAEAIITAALYAREKYKGKGNLEFYCTPHLLNVMLLARDLNGRRIYDSKSDLAAALNVKAIHTAEQFEDQVRTTKDGHEKKLLGLFVNLDDYHLGSTKGGEITRFSDFDIDFNSYKYLIETRLSGALVNPYCAIALEEPYDHPALGGGEG
jgi:HK97 family phage prohead protease